MMFNVIAKYRDEPKPRVIATLGHKSKYLEKILNFYDNENLESITIERA
jgi:hypothetical protein